MTAPLDGPRLRELRQRLGLTQRGLAEALGPDGPDPQTISDYERGVVPVRWPRIWELALERLLTR